MMMRHQPIIVLFLLSCVLLTQSRFRRLYDFEADNGICTGGCELRERSGASNGLATLMHEGDQLFIQFKTEANCSVTVENISYSTDGPEQDTINITLANVYLGSFNTSSQKGDGQLWNVFKDSGHVGPTIPLLSGFYELILTVSIDNFGVEVDKITLNFNCDSDPGEVKVSSGTSQLLSRIIGVSMTSFTILALITLTTVICQCIRRKKKNQYAKV